MRTKLSILGLVMVLAALATGCAGPQKKLGRGINNFTEIVRAGELRREVEQTALWDGPAAAYTSGMLGGLNRTFVRTVVGAYEIATFPFPSYEPILRKYGPILPDASVDPVWPDSYTPKLISDTTFEPDAALGFSGGDIAPFVPGSRFRIFDY